MSLLLKALAQINSRMPAEAPAPADEQPTAPDITAGAIEVPAQIDLKPSSPGVSAGGQSTPAETLPDLPIEKISSEPAVISIDSTTSLAAEFNSEIPAQTEEARPSSAVISEEAADQKLSAIDSTLQQLCDLCQAIDADVAQPAINLPAPAPPVPAEPEKVLPAAGPQVVVVKSPPTVYVPTVKVRDEFRVLKESISARLPLTSHATLLFVDGGRVQTDGAWLWGFAASILNGSSNQAELAVATASESDAAAVDITKPAPKILIVEAANSESSIASVFGIDDSVGLSDVLKGTTSPQTAIQESYHPQIRFLPRGSNPLRSDQADSLAQFWATLSKDFDLLLVAGGPMSDHSGEEPSARTSAVEILLPLAGGVILCVELDGTPSAACRVSKNTLDARGVRLLGCVVRGEIAA